MNDRLLVTGANGFVGAAIVKRASSLGYRVRGLTRNHPAPGADEHVNADVLDPAALRTAMQGVAVVIHAAGVVQGGAAANSPERLEIVNHQGTRNLTQAAADAGVRAMVLVSSVAVYGHSNSTRDESAPCSPEGAYGLSKWHAEKAATEIALAAGMGLTIVRLSTVYGEQDRGNVARLIHAIDRRRFVWLGEGMNRKSLIYVDDAATGCVLALRCTDKTTPLIFNVTAPPVTMRELVTTIADCLGRQNPRLRVPATIGRVFMSICKTIAPSNRSALRLSGWIEKWLANDEYDGRRFVSAAGFQPSVDLRAGIARQVQSYRLAACAT